MVDEGSVCSFEVSLAFIIPDGASISYNGQCYKPGDSGPSQFEVAGSGCGTAFLIQFTVYDNETCSGTGTAVQFAGACVATGETCNERD